MNTSKLAGIATILTIGALAVASVNPALARDGKMSARGPHFDFETLDANKDGKVTPQEMDAHREAEFKARDTDGDGLLSKDEMIAAAMERVRAGMEKRIGRMVEKRDADGDGKISLAEMPGGDERGARMFERMDADGDGAISAEEVAAMKDRGMRGKHRHGHGRDHGHGPRWMHDADK